MNLLIRIKKRALFLAFLGLALSSAAQTTDSITRPDIDTNYIEDYTGWLTTRIYSLYQNAAFIVSTNEVDNIVFKPNTNIKIGVAAFYKWFGIGLSINNPFYQLNESTYGKTSSIDLRINAFGRAVAAEVFFQSFKGFYISSPNAIQNQYYIVPGMDLFSIGAYGYWIYNPRKFSFRAAFIQNERQVKSAGSLMIRPGISFVELYSDTGIIPGELIYRHKLDHEEIIKRGQFLSLSLAPGYSYTFIFLKNAYINAAVFPGVSLISYSYRTKADLFSRSDVYSRSDFVFQLGLKIAAGYNTKKWYVGGSIITSFNDLDASWSNSSFFYDVSQFRVWGGMRFDVFRKKKKNNT